MVAQLYDKREDSVGFYAALIGLVQAGDPDGARSALRDAFTAMDEEWLGRHGHRPSSGDAARRRETRETREIAEKRGRAGAPSASVLGGTARIAHDKNDKKKTPKPKR